MNDEHGLRASVNTFYFHIKPTLDKNGNIVRMVNFVDFSKWDVTPMNWLFKISKGFFPSSILEFERIEEIVFWS